MKSLWVQILVVGLVASLTGPVALADSSSPGKVAITGNTEEVEIPLKSEGGGIWVDVRINDRVTHRMLLDTGASVMVVPANVAGDLGIHRSGTERELRTIQGSVKGRLVTLTKVGIGGATVDDVAAVVLDGDTPTVGLLGRSFLNNFAFSVDLDRNVLTLRPRKSAQVVPWREISPGQHVDQQLAALRVEVERAKRDPAASPSYLSKLQTSMSYWERRRSLYD